MCGDIPVNLWLLKGNNTSTYRWMITLTAVVKKSAVDILNKFYNGMSHDNTA